MGYLSRYLRRRRGYLSGRPEDLWRQLIAAHAKGATFLDVGCMWNVHGGYSFHALAQGASRVCGLDVEPATEKFLGRNRELGNPIEFVHGDLNDPALPDRLGSFDVVFCSGVLYHVPNPIFTITQLRALCRKTLILTTASTMERDVPNVAILLPFTDPAARAEFDFSTGKNRKVGLDSDFVPAKGYGNWFWLPTPSCVRAMVQLAGFTIRDCFTHRRVTTIVAEPTRPAATVDAPAPHLGIG